MRRRKITLTAISDEYDNAPGFGILGATDYEGFMADRTGEMIAHDLIEHVNGVENIGPIADELQAMGGIWFVRGQLGDFRNSYHTPASNVASDITRMARDSGWQDVDAPPRTCRCDVEEDIDDIIAISREDIPKELDADDLRKFDIEAYLNKARGHMRIGYRKAYKQWAGSSHDANNMYHEIERVLKNRVKYIDFEGQQFTLKYGGNLPVICNEEAYPDD